MSMFDFSPSYGRRSYLAELWLMGERTKNSGPDSRVVCSKASEWQCNLDCQYNPRNWLFVDLEEYMELPPQEETCPRDGSVDVKFTPYVKGPT